MQSCFCCPREQNSRHGIDCLVVNPPGNLKVKGNVKKPDRDPLKKKLKVES